MKKRIKAVPLSRRSFMVTAGGFSAAVAFGGTTGKAFAQAAKAATPFKPNAWVTIGADNVVTIVAPAAEMGQGVMTAMPALVAEDMDADWAKVKVVQAPADAKSYGNRLFGGAQVTGGSRTTQGYYQPLRIVGAQTRAVLIAAAAEQWKVPSEELTTEPGMVVHAKSKRKVSYGALAAKAKVPAELPKIEAKDLKPLEQCRYIGKDIPRVDVPGKTNGTAIYGMDVQVPGMLYGAILRAPVEGERPERVDDAEARAVKGVRQIVWLTYGVGVIADTVEATKKAKAALKVEWSKSAKARAYDSDKVAGEYLAIARDMNKKGVDVEKHGDADAAIAGAAKTITAEYISEHVTHACMEPMNATAVVRGNKVEVWAPNQSPTLTQVFAARTAGTTPPNVTVHSTLLGGGFGRRADWDFTVDAVNLAKAMPGTPVKMIWSREDDIRHGKGRPLVAQHMTVGLDANNNIVGWRHRLVGCSIYARFSPAAYEASKGKDVPFHEGVEYKYDFPAARSEFIRDDRGISVHVWRSVGSGYTKFAMETLLDQVAKLRNEDPVAYRLSLLKKAPRAAAVVQEAAKMADWGKKREGRALGIAYSDSWNTHIAQVVEISLNPSNGEIKVHNVWSAVDPGVALQPKNVEAQIESAVIYGVSSALYEQLDYKNGEPQQANFDTYRVLRMEEAPEVFTKVMPSLKDQPGGIGEVGLPPVAPAIANAVFALTGKKLTHLPMSAENVLFALKA
jgi:isoquinoline 1-oxidoreductase beta subunit